MKHRDHGSDVSVGPKPQKADRSHLWSILPIVLLITGMLVVGWETWIAYQTDGVGSAEVIGLEDAAAPSQTMVAPNVHGQHGQPAGVSQPEVSAAKPGTGSFFTGFGYYMPRIHCMTGPDGKPDWPWIITLLILNGGVIAAYLKIYAFWHRNYFSEEKRDRNVKLMDLAQVFLWCAVCGYVASIVIFVWPAYRLVVFALVVLNIWSWRFAMNLNSFRVSLSANRYRRLSETDHLTGLLNRTAMSERIRTVMDRAAARDDSEQVSVGAVLFVDFDRFKQVNDTFGHNAGDDLIQQIGRRIEAFCADQPDDDGRCCLAARVGGDEFVVLVEGVADSESAVSLGQKFKAVFTSPFTVADQPFHATASVGLRMTECGAQPEDILGDADIAMYEAKSGCQDHVVLFDASMRKAKADRMSLECDLRTAVTNEELALVYEPVIDLASGRVVGAEAFVIWRHPTRGVLHRDSFFDVVEEAGLRFQFDSWMLAAACGDLNAWREHTNDANLHIYVTLTRRAIQDSRMLACLDHAINSAGIDRGALHVQVSETELIEDMSGAAESMEVMRHCGVPVCLNEFGASLGRLN